MLINGVKYTLLVDIVQNSSKCIAFDWNRTYSKHAVTLSDFKVLNVGEEPLRKQKYNFTKQTIHVTLQTLAFDSSLL